MIRKRYIACLLLFIGLLMPVIPVFPHHHHADGTICLKHLHDLDDDSHCCCGTGCVASHFAADLPTQDDENEVQEFLLFTEPLFQMQFRPTTDALPPTCIYRETLHNTLARTVRGLRAPPMA